MPNSKGQPTEQLVKKEIGVRYVTIKDVTEMYSVSERTLLRWINEQKILPAIHDVQGHIRMDIVDVERVTKDRQVPRNPLYQQVQEHQKSIEQLQQEVKHLRAQIETMTGRERVYEQPLTALMKMTESSGESNVQAAATLKQLIGDVIAESGYLRTRKEATHGLAGSLEKRSLPDGTMRLVDFVKAHQPGMTLWEIKKAYLAGEIQLEVYQRESETKRNKQEWWITLEQHHDLITYSRRRSITSTECPLCASHDEKQQTG